MASEGFPIIGAAVFVTVYLAALGLDLGALFCLAVTLLLVMFFRDPHREVPVEQGAIVSPADGKVVTVQAGQHCPFIPEKTLKISIFMSVFNVHVNRMPADGTVSAIAYHSGKFFSANLDKASKDNEHNAVTLDMDNGTRLVVVQIAGLIARRIVCRIKEGARLKRGQRFGIICFGSRVDLYLPGDARPAVSVGDRVLAGTSILGHVS